MITPEQEICDNFHILIWLFSINVIEQPKIVSYVAVPDWALGVPFSGSRGVPEMPKSRNRKIWGPKSKKKSAFPELLQMLIGIDITRVFLKLNSLGFRCRGLQS